MILKRRAWVVEYESKIYTREEFIVGGESKVFWILSLGEDYPQIFGSGSEKAQELEAQFQRLIQQPHIASQCKSCEALAAMFGPTGPCRVICEEE